MDNKKTIAKKIATIAGIGILGTASLEAVAQDTLKVNKGFNAIEAGITDQGSLRTRVYTNIEISDNNLRVDYHGLNEISANADKGYFGRNTFMLGLAKNKTIRLANVVKLASIEGKVKVVDYKIGARINLPFNAAKKVAIDYGFLDVTTDGKALNLTSLIGKDLGKGWSCEVTGAAEISYAGKAGFYTELEGYKNLTKDGHVAVFGRVETCYKKDNTRAIAGVIARF
jgi:hypothetical protein